MMTACGCHHGADRSNTAIPSLIMEKKGQTCGVDEPSTRVIRTQEEWLSLWRDIGTDPPQDAFSDNTAVAVFLGQKPTGGYGVTLSEPHPAADGSLIIEYKMTTPSGFAIQMLTQPYAVKVFEKTAAELIIREAAP